MRNEVMNKLNIDGGAGDDPRKDDKDGDKDKGDNFGG